MREEKPGAKAQRSGLVATTNSDHRLPVYPNLAADMDITAPDQLWASDLTYIRLGHEFIYLAVVLDVCSRRCLGWSLGPPPRCGSGNDGLENGAHGTRKPQSAPFRSGRSIRFG